MVKNKDVEIFGATSISTLVLVAFHIIEHLVNIIFIIQFFYELLYKVKTNLSQTYVIFKHSSKQLNLLQMMIINILSTDLKII